MDWTRVAQLDFEPPDRSKFPLLGIAYEALRLGGMAGCVLNAADEVAVDAFVSGRISYLAIAEIVAATLQCEPHREPASISDVLECDREARALAAEFVARQPAPVPVP